MMAVSRAQRPLQLVGAEHAALHTIADEVEDPTDPEIVQLAAGMLTTLENAAGYAMAAPQVGVPLRVVVFSTGACYANPVLAWLERFSFGAEACLSLPGRSFLVNRARQCTVHAIRVGDGVLMESTETGFAARAWQHEVDHLDGELLDGGQWSELVRDRS